MSLLLTLLLLATTPHAPAASLAITHVTVIDPATSAVDSSMTVVIAGTRIVALGPSRTTAVPHGARVVDASSRFLIPGLWDMHVHLTDATASAFPRLVANGIAGVRDMGGNLDTLDRWRGQIARGERLGPLIVRAGPFVDGPKDITLNRLAITTPEAGRRAVDSLADRGVDFIKVHNALPRDAFFAVLSEARKRHLPVAVHLPHGLTVAEASDSGAASLEHIEMFIESAASRPGATATTIDQALSEAQGEAGAKIFATFVRNHTWYDPTFSAYYRGFVHWGGDPVKVAKRRVVLTKLLALAGDMHRAGVQFLAGSDFSADSVGVMPGADLHQELAFLVEAGLMPMEALQCATINPVRFLGREDSLGAIAVGKRADLVLLGVGADPLMNINCTRMIDAVVLGGRLIEIPPPRLARTATHH